jgi:simple sugar transport system permease protein
MKKITFKFGFVLKALPQIISVVITLIIAFLIIISTGTSPPKLFDSIVEVLSSRGSINLILEVLVPFLLCGLGFLIAIRGGLYNIGLQGQFLMGMIGASLIGGYLSLPAYLHGIVALLVGALFGFLWILPASILKVRKGAHEFVSTLMLTFIAPFVVLYLVKLPQIAYTFAGEPRTRPVLPTAQFPSLIPGFDFNLLHLLILALVVVSFFLLENTRIGLRIKAMGKDPITTSYAGINVDKLTFLLLGLSGALCGLAGAIYLITFKRFLFVQEITIESSLFGDAWMGIGTCFLGGLHPIGIIPAALFFAVMRNAILTMSFTTPMTVEFGQFLEGLILFLIAAPSLLIGIWWRAKKLRGEIKKRR